MKLKKDIHKSRLLALKGHKLLVLEKVGLKKQYTLPGGVQKKWETDFNALMRETEEEIGVELEREELAYFISIRNKAKDKKIVYKHYFVSIKDIKNPTLLEPEKFKNVTWVAWYEALEYLDKEDRKAVKSYCAQYIKEVT